MAEQQADAGGQAAEATVEELSLLDQAVAATKKTEPDQAKDLIKNLVENALDGTVTYDRNMTKTVTKAIAQLDAALSAQLAAIMHAPEFKKLEGSWRGLKYMVMNTETSRSLKIKVNRMHPRRPNGPIPRPGRLANPITSINRPRSKCRSTGSWTTSSPA